MGLAMLYQRLSVSLTYTPLCLHERHTTCPCNLCQLSYCCQMSDAEKKCIQYLCEVNIQTYIFSMTYRSIHPQGISPFCGIHAETRGRAHRGTGKRARKATTDTALIFLPAHFYVRMMYNQEKEGTYCCCCSEYILSEYFPLTEESVRL